LSVGSRIPSAPSSVKALRPLRGALAETLEQEFSQLAVESLGGYFRSHPEPAERLEQAQRVIAEQNWQQRTTQKPFRLAYDVRN
jgi:hypothetical protein